MKILIAEDDSSFALILSRTLKKIGHTVTVARDGTEAWAALQREAFPLVISDWMMPEMEGPELCRRIRARVGVPYTYVILLTSRQERQDRIDGLYSGADDFLAKPLEYGELFARLEIAQRILTMQEKLQRQNEELAETVAALARTERERERLAAHLQAALTPSIPRFVPGMVLTRYVEAARDEVEIAGDFYDVFPLDNDCTVLVVGDITSKGLAAAAQVETVRHMLRYALYRSPTLVGALQSLNALLVTHDLLKGFATLFVGSYDSSTQLLTYGNCGQEPALVRRASGAVEWLKPTGPVLGVFEDVVYEQHRMALCSGDALVVFTDGLTELGISRQTMLGAEGVAALLERQVVLDECDSTTAMAEHLASALIEAVDAAVQGSVLQDDVCLLVGVVT